LAQFNAPWLELAAGHYHIRGVGLCCEHAMMQAAHNVERPMSDCLHCDVNDLVEKQLERDDADLADLAARLAESLADLILLAPPADQSKLMADVLASLGQAYLEKTGAIESTPRH
jgi:hypothetical protein